jgi:hypothetical protein
MRRSSPSSDPGPRRGGRPSRRRSSRPGRCGEPAPPPIASARERRRSDGRKGFALRTRRSRAGPLRPPRAAAGCSCGCRDAAPSRPSTTAGEAHPRRRRSRRRTEQVDLAEATSSTTESSLRTRSGAPRGGAGPRTSSACSIPVETGFRGPRRPAQPPRAPRPAFATTGPRVPPDLVDRRHSEGVKQEGHSARRDRDGHGKARSRQPPDALTPQLGGHAALAGVETRIARARRRRRRSRDRSASAVARRRPGRRRPRSGEACRRRLGSTARVPWQGASRRGARAPSRGDRVGAATAPRPRARAPRAKDRARADRATGPAVRRRPTDAGRGQRATPRRPRARPGREGSRRARRARRAARHPRAARRRC